MKVTIHILSGWSKPKSGKTYSLLPFMIQNYLNKGFWSRKRNGKSLGHWLGISLNLLLKWKSNFPSFFYSLLVFPNMSTFSQQNLLNPIWSTYGSLKNARVPRIKSKTKREWVSQLFRTSKRTSLTYHPWQSKCFLDTKWFWLPHQDNHLA